MGGMRERARSGISSILVHSNPRSRNTLRAASRIRSSTSPASSLGGRPDRPGARTAERALVAAVLAISFILSLQIAKPASGQPPDVGSDLSFQHNPVKRTITFRSYLPPAFPALYT